MSGHKSHAALESRVGEEGTSKRNITRKGGVKVRPSCSTCRSLLIVVAVVVVVGAVAVAVVAVAEMLMKC